MPSSHEETWILAPLARAGESIDLDPVESAHLVRVLRLSAGTLCTVTDGAGSLFSATIEIADSRRSRLACRELLRRDPPPRLSLAQAVLKNRGMEDVLDLCAQTPLRAFQPLWTRRVQVPRGRDIEHQMERLRAKAVAALQQSKQTWLCEVLPPCDFEGWIRTAGPGAALCEVGGDPLSGAEPDWIGIGPEGGFAPEEIESARDSGARILSLGDSRLRATAAGFWALARFGL
jgi:16S rRNA (uracil1498-N3)-methyltransferase